MPRLRVDEPRRVERPDVALGGLRRVAEDQLEVGVGGEGRRRRRVARSADVHALVHRLEQPRERCRTSSTTSIGAFFAGGSGVGVFECDCGVHLRSIAARMLCTSAPELNSCIDSRATSTQMAQPKPCVSQRVTLPAASRAPMKQFSLLRWPSLSQPQ